MLSIDYHYNVQIYIENVQFTFPQILTRFQLSSVIRYVTSLMRRDPPSKRARRRWWIKVGYRCVECAVHACTSRCGIKSALRNHNIRKWRGPAGSAQLRNTPSHVQLVYGSRRVVTRCHFFL